MISIAGGEPLVSRICPALIDELIARNKVLIVCTNALLLEKKIDKFKPHPLFTWMIHLDGLRIVTIRSSAAKARSTKPLPRSKWRKTRASASRRTPRFRAR